MNNPINSKENESRLSHITTAIRESYKKHGGIKHLEEPCLPSKKEVGKLVKLLSTRVFTRKQPATITILRDIFWSNVPALWNVYQI
jgi:hypothetical protein